MGKNDFDYTFGAENGDDFDPKAFLDSDAFDGDMDLTEFSDEELGLSSTQEDPSGEEDFDLDGLGLDEDFDMGSSEEPNYDAFLNSEDLSGEPETDPFDPGQDPADLENLSEEDGESEERDEEMEYPDDDQGEDSGRNKRRRPKEKSFKVTLPKLGVPNIFTKFFDLYFAPILNKELREDPVDPNNPRRRRRKTPSQIFKEVYLPPILACLCLILVLSFVIGSVSNLIEDHKAEQSRKESQLSESISQAQIEQQRIEQLVKDAEDYATVYDYDNAISTLNSIGDLTAHQDIQAKISEYVTLQGQLQAHKDPSLIPNLSFNLLIEDFERTKADNELKGLYNRNFVTTGEFRKILEALYSNGYVLVDFDSFTASKTDTAEKEVFIPKEILLPAGKKPIMITETLANYFNYMVDGNGDNVADAQGYGFANKLVVQNGEIKAQYVDTNGQTLIGDYDLVPILETFIKEHPDFSYRGARAIIAVTGYEGIFGYRITSDYISSKGQDFVNQEIADAKVLVQALRDKGYTLACNTFKNLAYGQKSVTEISADLQSWTTQIVPVIGDVDVFVFVKNSPISNYTDAAFQQLYSNGFRYFVEEGTTTFAEVNTSYVRQKRFIVSGNTMAWKSATFTSPNMIFDPVAVLDVTSRGPVPNG